MQDKGCNDEVVELFVEPLGSNILLRVEDLEEHLAGMAREQFPGILKEPVGYIGECIASKATANGADDFLRRTTGTSTYE